LSVAHASPHVISVEAVDVARAGSLVQALVALFEAEDVSLDGESLEVRVRTRGDTDEAVLRVLDAVESWLAADGVNSTVIHMEGRSYRVTAPERAGTRS
jgi:hypothetical protein